MKRRASQILPLLLSLTLILHFIPPALAGITLIPGQGLVFTSTNALVLTAADALVLTAADALVLTAADSLTVTGADALVLTAADALTFTGADALVLTAADSVGLQSLDPELAFVLDKLPDTSAINVFVVFHRMPTETDFSQLHALGVLGGTRFYNLPMVIINATKAQIAAISALPSVRSVYSNKNFEFFTHETRVITGQARVGSDTALTAHNGGLPATGCDVTVAVLDTGIDASHPDLGYGGPVVENTRILDLQGTPAGFVYPIALEGLSNSDPIMGHGTHVAGIIAGSGAASGGHYGGMAPGAKLVGVAAGDASLFHVLSGIDYILSNRDRRNIRVVNCSFGISGLFDASDPVNIATKIMHDAGISVVFSAGNRGDQPNSLNPYSVAPWVIGVGSGTKNGKLSAFSSRGAPGYGTYHPTLVAPGENIVSARASGINLVATSGLASGLISEANDLLNISLLHLPSYTMSSGTSFAAPHVAGTIAMMIEANPQLTPDQIKQLLQETATPMLGYSRYEVGAGYLNTHAAVQKAALGRSYGRFRPGLLDQGVNHSREPLVRFSGEIAPGASYTTSFEAPPDTLFATAQICWVNANAASNLGITVSRGEEAFTAKPSSTIAGQAAQRSGVILDEPRAGVWTVTVRNLSILTGTPQRFVGAIELVRTDFGDLADIGQLSALEQQAIKRSVRSGLIKRHAGGFAPQTTATRLDVARALMLGAGAHVPQYLPATPSFIDVPPGEDAIFVESVVNSPSGNLMDATEANFNPQLAADRLTVAIATVKALGLESVARSSGLFNPGIADWNLIPSSLRGYVAVAVTRNLMTLGAAGTFRPFDPITRAELAWTASELQRSAR